MCTKSESPLTRLKVAGDGMVDHHKGYVLAAGVALGMIALGAGARVRASGSSASRDGILPSPPNE